MKNSIKISIQKDSKTSILFFLLLFLATLGAVILFFWLQGNFPAGNFSHKGSPQTTVSPQITTSLECNAVLDPADIVLILDGSDSITRPVFNREVKGFARAFAKELSVSSAGIHMGVIQYSDVANVEIPMDKFYTSDQLDEAIETIHFMGGTTSTGSALIRSQTMFSDSERKAKKIAVIVTDGEATDQFLQPAQELRDMGVQILAVGVERGNSRMKQELEQMTGNSTHVFNVNNFHELNASLIELLTSTICK